MRKTNKSMDYAKDNSKPFKTEKLWLAVPLATASILAGLAVTTPVNAATNTGNSDVEPATSETDSAAKNTNTPETETSNTTNTAESETTKDTDGLSTDGILSNENTDQSSSTTPDSGTANSENQTINNGFTGQTITTIDGNDNNPTTTVGVNPDTVASYSNQNESTNIQAAAESDETAPTESADTSNPTTSKAIDHVPNLSNFYVGVNGKYVPYNSVAMVDVLPYSSEQWGKVNDSDIGNNLFGFYIVLPSSVSSTLDWMQTGADDYVKALNARGYIHLNTLTVSKLANTQTGREVYYFRPDDAATILGSNPQKGFSSQLKMSVLIKTTDDKTAKTITINAKDDNGSDTFGTGQLPINDVLFAGIGDTTVYPHGNEYEAMPSSTFGNDWPDANIVGIASNNGAKQLSFTSINVVDHYYLRGTTAGSTTLAAVTSANTSSMTPGTSYNPSTYQESFTKILNNNKNNWWIPSFRYVGTTSNIGKLPYDSATQTLPASVTVEPTSLDLTDPNNVQGKTYAFIVAHIATDIENNDTTIDEGTTWHPDDNITFTMPSAGESSTITHEKISDMTLTTTAKNAYGSTTYTYTDADGTMTITSNVDTSKPGTYTVSYSYKDKQENINDYQGTSVATKGKTKIPATATVTVVGNNHVLKTNDSAPDITASKGTWTYDQGITELKDKSGKDITPENALADTTDPLTVTVKDSSGNTLKNSDGTNATSIDTSKPGKYTVTYTYGKQTSFITLNIAPSTPSSSTNRETVISGPKMSWNPVAGVTLPEPTVSAQDALSKGDLTYEVTDANGDSVANKTIDNSTPAGDYTVTYTYNGSVLTVSTIKVEKPTANLAVGNKTIAAGTKWTPFEDFKLSYENSPVNISTLPTGSSLTAAVMNSDGKPVNADTIDTSKAGTYTITYTYTDPVGNPFIAKSTLTITPATSGSSSNTGSGNDNNSSSGNTADNGTGNNGSENPGDTDPGNTTDSNDGSGSNSDSGSENNADSDSDKNDSASSNSNNNTDSNSNTGSESTNTNISDNNDDTNSENSDTNVSSSNLIPNTSQNDNLNMGTNTHSAVESNTDAASVSNAFDSTENINPQSNSANGGQLPQTSEKSSIWSTQLGLFLLAIAGVFGFRRKKN